jgi:hypothetical protein
MLVLHCVCWHHATISTFLQFSERLILVVYWYWLLVIDRIIDNRTLKLITESSDSSPKTDKELDSSLRGNYFLLLDIMFAYLDF